MVSKSILLLATFLSFSTMASAQSISLDRLGDWKFRFYACKNVLASAVLIIDIMEEQNITDQRGIDIVKSALGIRIASTVIESEKNYNFEKGEAAFISDLTFAVVSSMVYVGYKPSANQLFLSGSEICVQTIEAMTDN